MSDVDGFLGAKVVSCTMNETQEAGYVNVDEFRYSCEVEAWRHRHGEGVQAEGEQQQMRSRCLLRRQRAVLGLSPELRWRRSTRAWRRLQLAGVLGPGATAGDGPAPARSTSSSFCGSGVIVFRPM